MATRQITSMLANWFAHLLDLCYLRMLKAAPLQDLIPAALKTSCQMSRPREKPRPACTQLMAPTGRCTCVCLEPSKTCVQQNQYQAQNLDGLKYLLVMTAQSHSCCSKPDSFQDYAVAFAAAEMEHWQRVGAIIQQYQ